MKINFLIIGLLPIILVFIALSSAFDGFPLGDIGAHAGEIIAIYDNGYLQPTPQWENGEYLAGIFYFPLSFWIGALLLNFFAISQIAFGLMMLFYLLILYFSKNEFKSWLLAIAFVSLAFFNRTSINILIESTRYGTIMAFIFFILFLFILVRVLKNNINFKEFVMLSALWSLSILTYVNVGLGVSILFLSLFLIKREVWKWVYVPIIAFLPNLLWLTPYLTESSSKPIGTGYIVTSVPLLFVILMGFGVIVLAWLYAKSDNSNIKNLLLVQIIFYSVVLIIKGILAIPIVFFDRFLFSLHLLNLIVLVAFFLTKYFSQLNFEKNKLQSGAFIALIIFSSLLSLVSYPDLQLDFTKTNCKDIDSVAEDIVNPFVIFYDDSCFVGLESYILDNYRDKINFLSPIAYATSLPHVKVKESLRGNFDNCNAVRRILVENEINSFVCGGSLCEKLGCLPTISKGQVFEVKTT